MAKSIATVGFEIPGYQSQYVSLDSDTSLLDFDIIVFRPDIAIFVGYHSEQYRGKPCLSDNRSFKLQERSAKWRSEILAAFDHGKTIFVYLTKINEVYVATGTESYSGTGRNQKTTRHVTLFSNYSILPLDFDEITTAVGKEIRGISDLGFLSTYWGEFGLMSNYEIHLSSKSLKPLLITKSGAKTVGGIVQSKSQLGKGRIILLPQLKFEASEFFTEKDGVEYWSKKGIQAGHRLVRTLVEIDEYLRSATQRSPTPDWVTGDEFRLPAEELIERNVAKLTEKIESLSAKKRELLDDLGNEITLKSLLFETGAALEDGILQALKLLGLEAERFKEGESEFDAVFTWNGKRFLGEAEGKEQKALNVDKISQLERNLSEDFAREDVTDYAKGILFGNAFRQKPLSERGDYFTEKCISTAKRLKAALVKTPDLFFIAKYLKAFPSQDYADECIQAILDAEGTVVVFPSPPNSGSTVIVNVE